MFHAIGMDELSIADRVKYINRRDQYAHAAGKRNLSTEELTSYINEVTAQAEAVHDVFKPIIKGRYIDYLLSHYNNEYSALENCVNDFITENMLSLWDLKYLCNLGISGIRNENEEFKSKYRFIKKVRVLYGEHGNRSTQ